MRLCDMLGLCIHKDSCKLTRVSRVGNQGCFSNAVGLFQELLDGHSTEEEPAEKKLRLHASGVVLGTSGPDRGRGNLKNRGKQAVDI